MSAPFVVFGLPRSRSFWLSNFLSYGRWHCAHDRARYVRSVEDVKSWLSLDWFGAVETGAAQWWRLARHYRPDLKIAVVRRDPAQVVARLAEFGFFAGEKLGPVIKRCDRALDSAARAPGCLTISYDELASPAACARLFEHCLEQPFDREWWEALDRQNLQIDLRAQIAEGKANLPQMLGAAKACARAQRYFTLRRAVAAEPDDDGIVIQEEPFHVWWRDAQDLIAAHCVAIGQPADAAQRMNLPLWDAVNRAGAVQIMTARLNGRMMGYLTAVLMPSFEARDMLLATQFSFFVDPAVSGLQVARRLQRAAIDRARARGCAKMYFRAGVRGDGPRLGSLYKRMGAHDFGQLYEMDIG